MKPDNPYAFPWTISETEEGHEGMTLRDYFAAAALQSMFAFVSGREWKSAWAIAAQDCYEMADHMLKAREPQPKDD